MTGLQADELSNEFLKNFLPETIFLVDGDVPVTIAPEAAPIVSPQPETIVAPEPRPAATPALPKLPKTEAPAAQPAKFEVIGENRKGVAVLVTIADAEFRKLPQLEFLNKILLAIGLQPTDVAYVNNVSGANTLFEDLKQALQVNYILSFASRVESNLPHEKFTLYNPVLLGNVPIVFSHALSDLEHDQEKKRLLWAALQKVFK
ncbi:hypothetical protein H7F15_04345 [Pontibacter sp. Tf4]|uniref:hypothetical protein n=1 Tax=Pontibacter sp. Tf4 TaxID=2761620 RepID=UPI001624F277|nr:hypothetical protein [Pontibacter sp. Tf4]MBB6610259.1 hypothetical protein [Pontibacter sp. Tf4]